jgi:hypothetical protein
VSTIGLKDRQLDSLLGQMLDDPDPEIREQATSAVGCLRMQSALPALLARVREGGIEAELAAQSAARLGAKGTHSLRKLMSEVGPGLRRRIAAALPAGDSATAESAALALTLDADPNLVDATARSFIARVPELGQTAKEKLGSEVSALLKQSGSGSLSAFSEAALVRILAALGNQQNDAMLWARIDARRPLEVRLAALQSLGNRPVKGAKNIQRLLVDAQDSEFRIVAPVLVLLKHVKVDARQIRAWLPLFSAPDPAVRQFAIEKLGKIESHEVAKALLRQLDFSEPLIRENALAQLAQTKHGREQLVESLLHAPSADEAWSMARIQASFAHDYSRATRSAILHRACRYIECDDRRADALVFLLREADAKLLKAELERRAANLQKKKAFVAASRYLRLLVRDPSCGDLIRLDLAACGLKISNKSPTTEARAADPCLQQFASLIHRHELDILQWLEKASWLNADDLFYLGFHFVEGSGPDKELGARALRLVLQRFPRNQKARLAKNKLRSQGLK